MSYLTCRLTVCLCILAAISSTLYAVDGVALINQASALAGNVTPGDAPGFPVTISQPGSYRLSGNLTVADLGTTAILITADDVNLDLNGFSIIGPNVCTPDLTACVRAGGLGVQAGDVTTGSGGPRNIRVINGIVRGMGAYGIRMTGQGTAVENINATGNGNIGIAVAFGSVTDSVARLNLNVGILAQVVRGCIAEGNSGDGISARFNGLAFGNIANFNGVNGISVEMGTATGNTANSNTKFGISADCPSSVVGNTVTGNASGNIQTSSGACTLANNTQ